MGAGVGFGPQVGVWRHKVLGGSTVSAALLLLVPVLVVLVAGWHYRWMSDDGFINLRVVREVMAGHGPVFNPGERVEASTSPLWLAILVVGDIVLPLRLEWIAVLFGIGLTTLGLVFVILGAMRLAPDFERQRTWFPVGALVLAALAPMWKFESSGLENGLSFAWLGACFMVLATWSRRDTRLRYSTAVLLGLGPLVRPEIGLFSIAALAVVIVGEWDLDSWPRRIAIVSVALAIPLSYEIFRMGFYASLVPNSALAKEAGRAYWSSGWRYLREAVMPYQLWVPLVLLVATAYVPLCLDLRRNGRTRALVLVIVFGVTALIDAIYIVRVGGDFMRVRLLLPAVFAFAAPVAVVPWRRAYAAALLVVPWALIAFVSLRSSGDYPAGFSGTKDMVTTDEFGAGRNGWDIAWFHGHGVYFIDHPIQATPIGHDPEVATYGVGLVGYALGPNTYVLDLLGLGDAFTSHLKLAHRGVVAHEKPLPLPWIAARLTANSSELTPASFPLPAFFVARPLDHPGHQSFQTRVVAARAALRCGELRDFVSEYSGHLDASRFLSNLGAAVGNYTFRIPPEPRDAAKRFCPPSSNPQ